MELLKNMGPPMTNDTYLPPKPTFAIENETGMIVFLTFADVHHNLTEKFYFVEIWFHGKIPMEIKIIFGHFQESLKDSWAVPCYFRLYFKGAPEICTYHCGLWVFLPLLV